MFTQGKRVVTTVADTGHYAVQIEHGQIICEFDPLSEAEDNAKLDAVAPDLLKLVQQYKGDVETRITCIREERNNLDMYDLAPYHQEAVEDCNVQIDHWKATLAGIEKVLEKVGG